MAIVRSFHGGKPFYSGHNCPYRKPEYRVCTGKGVVVLDEVDYGEMIDITLFRTLAVMLDEASNTEEVARLLAEKNRLFSIPNIHADLASYLEPSGLRHVFPDWAKGYNFQVKPMAIVIIDDKKYMEIVREAYDEEDYRSLMISDSRLIIGLDHAVPTLAYVAYLNADELAKSVKEACLTNIVIDIDEYTVAELLRRSYMEMRGFDISEYLINFQTLLRDIIYEESNLPIDDIDVSIMDDIDNCLMQTIMRTHGLLYKFIAEGRYPEPVPTLIYAIFYPETRYEAVFTGCDAYRRVKDFLPERDAAYLARLCGS